MAKRAQKSELTIAAVRASQDLSATTIPLIMRYFFVPAAWPLTLVALQIGLSPNGATLLRAAASGGAIFCISSADLRVHATGFVLLLLSLIGDSVDGNLCRIQDRASYFGKFLDGLVDIITDLLFPLALAAHLWLRGDGDLKVMALSIAGSLALASIFIVLQRASYFDLVMRKEASSTSIDVSAVRHAALRGYLYDGFIGRLLTWIDKRSMNAVFDIRYTALIVALITDRLVTYVAFLGCLYITVAIVFDLNRIVRTYAALDVSRRSRSVA